MVGVWRIFIRKAKNVYMFSPWLWLVLTSILVFLDQFFKSIVVAKMDLGVPIHITKYLSMSLTYNPGAAFSFLADAGGWQRGFLCLVSACASAVLVFLLFRFRNNLLMCLSFSLILSGALGNLIDRFFIGAVVDFVVLHWQGWFWPAFNLADSCITLGALFLLIESFFSKKSFDIKT